MKYQNVSLLMYQQPRKETVKFYVVHYNDFRSVVIRDIYPRSWIRFFSLSGSNKQQSINFVYEENFPQFSLRSPTKINFLNRYGIRKKLLRDPEKVITEFRKKISGSRQSTESQIQGSKSSRSGFPKQDYRFGNTYVFRRRLNTKR
jgi:hypothetical protein